MLPAWATIVLSLISGLAGAAGGVAATWLRMRFDRRQAFATRTHERELGDLAELRAVLDDAAATLAQTEVAASEAVNLWARASATRDAADEARADEAGNTFWNWLHTARAASRRVAIRLPAHEVTASLIEAVDALYEGPGKWLMGVPQPPGSERVFGPAGVARDQFAARASALVRSQLPPTAASPPARR